MNNEHVTQWLDHADTWCDRAADSTDIHWKIFCYKEVAFGIEMAVRSRD